jgi:hypothetical protein
MRKIVYIGTKEQKGDNVAQTGLVWTRGQIHEVLDDKKADKLLEHPHVWADAESKYEMVPEMALVPKEAPAPKVSLIVEGQPLLDYTLSVDADVVTQLNAGTLIAVFMSPVDADDFDAWKKLEAFTAPKKTGPRPQDKETKAGLDHGKKAA